MEKWACAILSVCSLIFVLLLPFSSFPWCSSPTPPGPTRPDPSAASLIYVRVHASIGLLLISYTKPTHLIVM